MRRVLAVLHRPDRAVERDVSPDTVTQGRKGDILLRFSDGTMIVVTFRDPEYGEEFERAAGLAWRCPICTRVHRSNVIRSRYLIRAHGVTLCTYREWRSGVLSPSAPFTVRTVILEQVNGKYVVRGSRRKNFPVGSIVVRRFVAAYGEFLSVFRAHEVRLDVLWFAKTFDIRGLSEFLRSMDIDPSNVIPRLQ